MTKPYESSLSIIRSTNQVEEYNVHLLPVLHAFLETFPNGFTVSEQRVIRLSSGLFFEIPGPHPSFSPFAVFCAARGKNKASEGVASSPRPNFSNRPRSKASEGAD